jgi:hypothetical protein
MNDKTSETTNEISQTERSQSEVSHSLEFGRTRAGKSPSLGVWLEWLKRSGIEETPAPGNSTGG